MEKTILNVKKFDHFPDGADLIYGSKFSSGIDLVAAIDEDIILNPLQREIIPTGISIELSIGFEAQIRPRSGLAAKNGITVLNSPSTIDNDYRGEIKVILINLGYESFVIKKKMRIAQMVLVRFSQADIIFKTELNNSDRSDGGFGSTGTH